MGGVVAWDDKVKGRIEISNDELDDLVIARPDGTPTYNFCVVVDDIDMAITHVIRGDDHVNNTPRQINIFRALGKEPPVYAHLPTVLNEQGEKMSKRNGAKPVTQYRDEGYLPDAMVNYLARLGWSHGDDEIFSREQFLAVVQPRPPGPQRRAVRRGQAALGQRAAPEGHGRRRAGAAGGARSCDKRGIDAGRRAWPRICGLFKDRCDTHGRAGRLGAALLCRRAARTPTSWRKHVTDAVRPAIAMLAEDARERRLGQGRHHRSASRKCCAPRPQDAATGDAGARAGDGHGADAVARCGAGACATREIVLAAPGEAA